jgi:S-DNA-T family DNA segregation ATPase FtsK/SpoIIIE
MAQAIAQKGRAAGIHMVICTQRPSTKVIPGDFKAVIPSRLSFRLPTGVDSKVILDEPGAEDLLGKGDMFLKETTHPELRRFQGALVTNDEIQKFAIAASSLWGGKSI